MLRLSTSFILGYHGCDHRIAERLLKGEAFASSQNEYDWLGSGVYFWEANPQRGLDFARVSTLRSGSTVRNPAVVGAVIDLGLCLDLMTMAGIAMLREAHAAMVEAAAKTGQRLPENQGRLRRQLDCAVIGHFHAITGAAIGGIDTVRGVFTEGDPIYPGAAFHTKTHIQIAVPNLACIKGVFRVPSHHLPA